MSKHQLQQRLCDLAVKSLQDPDNNPENCSPPLAAQIAEAQKFFIDETMASAACQLMQQHPKSLLKAINMVRCPYPLMWVECALKDRDFALKEDIEAGRLVELENLLNLEGGRLTGDPSELNKARVGWLLKEIIPGHIEIHALQDRPECLGGGVQINLLQMFIVPDGNSAELYKTVGIKDAGIFSEDAQKLADTSGAMNAYHRRFLEASKRRFKDGWEDIESLYERTSIQLSRWITYKMAGAIASFGPDYMRGLGELSAVSLEGDDLFIRALLTLMNSKNMQISSISIILLSTRSARVKARMSSSLTISSDSALL